MPELPEVETVRNVLKGWVVGKTIKDVNAFYEKVLEGINLSDFRSKIVNQRINDIGRMGKYLLFVLDDYILLSHLRMEGKYYLINDEKMDEKTNKHKIISFHLDDGSTLLYHDVRKFGKMKLLDKNNYLEDESLKRVGKEPFDIKGNELYLQIKSSNKTIKELLLDQSIMAGLGNIYVDEVLFSSKIYPLRKGKEVSLKECDVIVKNSVIVLNKAIELGGSTIKTYHSGNKVDGRFQNELNVYGKKGEKCPNCGTLIEKMVVGGRGTHYCHKCQK